MIKKQIWIFAVLLLVGCSKPVNVALIPGLQQSSPYFEELEHWHQQKKVYADFKVLFYVHATYMSPSLVRAYVAEYAQLYRLTNEEQHEMLDKKMAELTSQRTLFLSIFAPGKNAAKIDSADDIWRLRVSYTPTDKEYQPLYVRKVSLDDPKVGYFHPYAEEWATQYTVSLPVELQSDELVFYMDGVIGKQEFRWPVVR